MPNESEPIPLELHGEAAALVAAEAIFGECSHEQVVLRALSLYGKVATELRAGGEFYLKKDITNNTNTGKENRLTRLANRFADKMLGGGSDRETELVQIDLPYPIGNRGEETLE